MTGSDATRLHPLPGGEPLVVDDLGRVIQLDTEGRLASGWLV